METKLLQYQVSLENPLGYHYLYSLCVSCGCMDMWLVFLTLILLTRFSQRGSLMSGGGQRADLVPRGCTGCTASKGDGDGPGICLGDGQTEAPGVPAESGRSDALLQSRLPYLT